MVELLIVLAGMAVPLFAAIYLFSRYFKNNKK